MNFIEGIKKPISNEMLKFSKVFSNALSTDNPMLETVNEYILQKSGKQLRPILVVLAAKLCGDVTEETLNSALSLELLHTASLIHDDVVDDTQERRGKPSINAKWTNKIAILSGDYILSKSLGCAVETGNLPILKAISNIGVQLADGELLQLISTRIDQESEEKYYTIIRKKTALLFSTCTEIGALSVNANEAQLESLKNYGEYLGICFQIKDDIFDYQSDIEIGKPTGNDIRDGKVTLPLIHAILNADDEEEKAKALTILADKNFSPENISFLTGFAFKHNGVEYACQKMEEFKNKAIDQLNGFADSEVKNSLILCAEYAAMRSH